LERFVSTEREALDAAITEMAELLGVSVRTAHGYANGGPIPEPVARFLALTLSKYQRGRSPAAADSSPAPRLICLINL